MLAIHFEQYRPATITIGGRHWKKIFFADKMSGGMAGERVNYSQTLDVSRRPRLDESGAGNRHQPDPCEIARR